MPLAIDAANEMLYDAVSYALNTEPSKKRAKDANILSAFDGTRILIQYVFAPGEEDSGIESLMTVSLSGTAVKSQKKEDLDAILREVYPGLVQPPSEAGFQVMLQFSIDAIEGDKDEFAKKVSLLKHYACGATLYAQFKALATGSVPPSPPVEVQHRPEESYWIVNSGDKVFVAHSMHFVDEDERVVAELILKGMNYDHKIPNKGGAPGVRYSDEMPGELTAAGIAPPKTGGGNWITATYFSNHVQTPEKMQTAVANAQNLRTFVGNHCKAAKTYMSSKMRTRIEYFEKVLDRAVPAKEQNKGAASLMAVGVAGKLMSGIKKKRAGGD